ncbi:ABC transporter permease [Paenibacillus sp. sptzw28]|uniref:ABC transporter permease n=1 Tax=Paenibacillus sp. sptzw28 TaxID=715179 RepID=UPI001C6F4CBF|nr:ABC transporter permease [Paenibacillus sp. sptzw28]QYR23011.1 ABC transporter permease [Paenibacillus sp. sptzw28]
MVGEYVKIAIFSIAANRLRSFLTMVGIIVGVSSVITIVAIGQSGEQMLKQFFSTGGKHTLDIDFRYFEEEGAGMGGQTLSEPLFTERDIELIRNIPEISQVIAVNTNTAEAGYLDRKANVQLTGISHGYEDINPMKITQGRWLAAADIRQSRKSAVIGERLADKLFNGTSALGAVVEVEGVPFKVVGIAEEDSGPLAGLAGSRMYVPLSVWPVMYGKDEIQALTIQAADENKLQTAGEKAVELLNQTKKSNRKTGEYTIFNLEELRKSLSTISRIMTSIIGGIAGISLFVGGIGVMNIMLVSVTERTKEIGIRKALGATRGEILTQFLIESVILTTAGGIIGVSLGWGCSYLVSMITHWPPMISWPVVAGGVLFSMLIGIGFGILPASRASKLLPIQALRHE